MIVYIHRDDLENRSKVGNIDKYIAKIYIHS